MVQRFDRHGLDTERAEKEASVQLWDVTHTFPTSGGIHEHDCLGEFTVDIAFGFVSLQDYQTHRAQQPFTGTLLLLRQVHTLGLSNDRKALTVVPAKLKLRKCCAFSSFSLSILASPKCLHSL